jgi:DNA-binding IclR family transcriptional regulator
MQTPAADTGVSEVAMARPSPQTERVVDLVDLLASRPDDALSLSEISSSLGVNKATCHAMLATLTRAGWLLRHPTRKTYRLGPTLASVGRIAAADIPALEFARPTIVELSHELGLVCLALAPSDDHLTVLDEVGPAPVVRAFRIGEQVPVRPPFGAGFVAWSEPGTRDRWLDQAAGDGAGRSSCERALEAARRRGFAVELVTEPEARLRAMVADLGESLSGASADRPDTTRMRALLEQLVSEPVGEEPFLPIELESDECYRVSTIGAPVFDAHGRVALVLVLVSSGIPVAGKRVEAIGRRLAGAADAVTAALGG